MVDVHILWSNISFSPMYMPYLPEGCRANSNHNYNKYRMQVIILPDGRAKELNTVHKPSNESAFESSGIYNLLLNEWKDAESKLKTFDIEDHSSCACGWAGTHCLGFKESCPFKVGSIHQAELVNDKVRIID